MRGSCRQDWQFWRWATVRVCAIFAASCARVVAVDINEAACAAPTSCPSESLGPRSIAASYLFAPVQGRKIRSQSFLTPARSFLGATPTDDRDGRGARADVAERFVVVLREHLDRAGRHCCCFLRLGDGGHFLHAIFANTAWRFGVRRTPICQRAVDRMQGPYRWNPQCRPSRFDVMRARFSTCSAHQSYATSHRHPVSTCEDELVSGTRL